MYFKFGEIDKDYNIDDGDLHNLDNALYTISELGMWYDEVDSISPEQAMMIYKVVDKVLKDGFPEELRR